MPQVSQLLPSVSAATLVGVTPPRSRKPLELLDVPGYAAEFLDLRGINIPAPLLRGMSENQLLALAHRADQAGCPCLVVVDGEPLDFTSETLEASIDRVTRLARVAKLLGCAHIGIRATCGEGDAAFSETARGIRAALESIHRVEVMMLLRPGGSGICDVERFTSLIQKIGGFRIGALPTMDHVRTLPDPTAALRRMTPYSGCIELPLPRIKTKLDSEFVQSMITTVQSVGYQNSICFECDDPKLALRLLEGARALLKALMESDGKDQPDESAVEEVV
ncbi:MAG: hypothetical protein O2800_05150 [Planctomycetota bacterium]|nr:hypothetical protein [Planctomycetota bacterium]